MKHDTNKNSNSQNKSVIKKATKLRGIEKTKGKTSNGDWSVQVEVLWEYFLFRKRGEGFYP